MRQSRVLLCALTALSCPSITEAQCACGAQLTGSATNGFSYFFDTSLATDPNMSMSSATSAATNAAEGWMNQVNSPE